MSLSGLVSGLFWYEGEEGFMSLNAPTNVIYPITPLQEYIYS